MAIRFPNFKKDVSKPLSTGDRAEAQARQYLCDQGLEFIEQNYSCPPGEIDIIMREGSTLVFVEVRFRKSASFGGAAASISAQKCERVRRSAEHYLQKHALLNRCPVRFDVVAITGADVNWITGAF